jgi:hypothetical protein
VVDKFGSSIRIRTHNLWVNIAIQIGNDSFDASLGKLAAEVPKAMTICFWG